MRRPRAPDFRHTVRGAFVCALAAATLVLAGGGSANATTILPLDLEALVAKAERVFVGRVVAVRRGQDAHGLSVTWTTFAVDEHLKGAATSSVTIKQLGNGGWNHPGALLGIPALPTYAEREEVMLFLHPESAAGFTSPVGLGQGCFRIRRTDGRPTVQNDVGNVNLIARTTPVTPQAEAGSTPAKTTLPALRHAEPLPLTELIERVRTLSAEAR